jgi:hypothetical protein
MGPIGIGRQRLELMKVVKESPESLLVRRSMPKVGMWIPSLARLSLLCGMKGRLVIKTF